MELLSSDQAKEWCRERGLAIQSDFPFSIEFPPENGTPLGVPLPRDAQRSIALANVILMSVVEEDDEDRFEGGLLWFRDWNIGSETVQRVGLNLLQRVRGSPTDVYDLSGRPAHLLDRSQLVTAQTLLMLPMVFRWDAYYVPHSGRWLAFVSHEGFVQVQTQSELLASELAGRFDRGGWLQKQ